MTKFSPDRLTSAKRTRVVSFEQEEEKKTKDDSEQQPDLISELKERYLENDEEWYLISSDWYIQWHQYCSNFKRGFGYVRPGPIDNRSIIKDGNKLAEGLILENTVYAVPEIAWNKLVEWYGVCQDTEPIKRVVITRGHERTVELYPPFFKLCIVDSPQPATDLTRCPTINLSSANTIQELLEKIRHVFDLKVEDDLIQLWQLPTEPITAIIPLSDLTGAQPFATDDRQELIEEGRYWIAIEILDRKRTERPLPDRPQTRGVCGLQNLGNTCFMNSALQCLSNTGDLTRWFLAQHYLDDLNRQNPLGMRGELAEAYGSLLKTIWAGRAGHVAPRDFKYTIGRFNSAFSGYGQQDTQELLAFLLDGLHEDLNRIIKKPYRELPDFGGLEDKEIADRSWEYHLARNDSIIVDLFQGQFKSKLVCSECQNVSVTFDPFMYLSLPLPIKKKAKISIVYVPYDPTQKSKRLVVTLSKEATIGDLQKQVAMIMAVENPDCLLVTEIFNHKIYKVFPHHEPVDMINTSDLIYLYQLPVPIPTLPKQKRARHDLPDDWTIFPVYNSNSERPFGEPLVLATKETQPDRLNRLILTHLRSDQPIQLKVFSGPESLPIIQDWTNLPDLTEPLRQGEGIVVEWPKETKRDEPEEMIEKTDERQTVSLGDCLDEFTHQEELGQEDLWYCPKCKAHQRATKKLDIWRLPKIMVVHLKRFSHSRTWRDKIDDFIDFPVVGLDLTGRVLGDDQEDLIYDLYGVDNHYGGIGGGHYTSYAKNFENGNWYNFNDSQVSRIDESEIKTSAAYLLFYKRRTPDEPTESIEDIMNRVREKRSSEEHESLSFSRDTIIERDPHSF